MPGGSSELRRSPLDGEHHRLGARFAEFGGWEMPLAYEGTVHEHLACRSGVAVFDVSHLGTVRCRGAGAVERLRSTLSNDLDRIGPGRAQYTFLLDDDGSVLDDLIVWWHPDGDTLDVMPNASNTDRVRAAVGGDDITADRAVIAIQGPSSAAIVGQLLPDLTDLGRFRIRTTDWRGTTCLVAGTGYTGERGVEIAVPVGAAASLWRAVVDAGAVPAGLGARDTLRLEAALPLHGQDIGPGITPLQAGLDRFVVLEGREFPGRDALLAERARGPHRHLIGVATEGRRPPRRGSSVLVGGETVGEVTSGNFSPVLGHGIALALVNPGLEPGDSVTIDVRGSALAGRVVDRPFVGR